MRHDKKLVFGMLVYTMAGALGQLALPILLPFYSQVLDLSIPEQGFLGSAPWVGNLLLVVWAGRAISKQGIFKTFLIGPLLIGCAIIIASFQNSLMLMYVFWLFVGFGNSFIAPLSSQGIGFSIPNKFVGLAMGCKQSCVNIGGAIAAGLIPLLIFQFDLAAAQILSGVIIISATFILLAWLKSSIKTLLPQGKKLNDMIQTTTFSGITIFIVGMVGMGFAFAQSMTAYFLIPFCQDVLKLKVTEGAALLITLQMGCAIGRIVIGYISDIVSRPRTLIVTACIGSVFFLLFDFLAGITYSLAMPLLYANVFLLGSLTGGYNGAYYAMVADMGPQNEIASRTGSIIPFTTTGLCLGPLVGGIVIGRFGYQCGFITMSVFLIACVILHELFKAKPKMIDQVKIKNDLP